MEKMLFVLVLVLASTIGGGCYEIDDIEIENCENTDTGNDPKQPSGDVYYQLNCDGCGRNGYPYSIQYKHNFSINCENEKSSHFKSGKSSILLACMNNALLMFIRRLSLNSTFFELENNTDNNNNQKNNDSARELIKQLAAIIAMWDASILESCPFTFGGNKCNVTFKTNSSSSTRPTRPIRQTITLSTTPEVANAPGEYLTTVLPPIFVILTLIILLGIAIVVSFVLWYILRSKRQNTPKDLYAAVVADNRSTTFRLATIYSNTTNTKVNNDNNNTEVNNDNNNTEVNNDNNNTPQDAVYTDIMENNMGGRISSNSQDTQTNDPVLSAEPDTPTPSGKQYGLEVNVLYAGFVEGEVADTKLYRGLPYMKNQSPYTIEANPLYNLSPAKPFQEPACSLPELESAFEGCLYEIETGALDIGDKFASGQFGVVYRGTYRTEKGDIPVAVKALKDSVSKETIVAFMREAAIMAQFSHPNVLRLLGVKTTQQPWMIVTELLKTELRELLLKFRDAPSLRGILLKFTVEIADGMEYLAMRNFVHRDLAARNVLVAKDLTIRIADFGMSREVGSEKNYYTSSGGIVPLRWTAPEAVFYQKYSEKSDVWSYGMTLYEIWTLGDKPWGSATNQEIIEALSSMTSISPPPGCPEGVGRIMLETWKHEKIDRPTFTGVKAMLSQL